MCEGITIAILERYAVIILCYALVCSLSVDGQKKRVVPVAGPDIYKGKNVAKDFLAPGEKIANVLDFGAKADGKTDSTQVNYQHALL